jgi:Fe-S-cluster-containing dehydrogenase component
MGEMSISDIKITRRDFLKTSGKTIALVSTGIISTDHMLKIASGEAVYDWEKHYWGFVVDTTKCIGCGRCAWACKHENHVPFEEPVYRTWVERYTITKDDELKVESPNGGIDGFPDTYDEKDVKKSFFVPKLCNHCDEPPCVQVCPVGATYKTKDGVVLVDQEYCVGCRYCIQACPYGARYLYPEDGEVVRRRMTADKCTWCYHRITRGKITACAQACPVGARVIGDLREENSEVNRILATQRVGVLKPELGTEPKVYYVGLDKEVR